MPAPTERTVAYWNFNAARTLTLRKRSPEDKGFIYVFEGEDCLFPLPEKWMRRPDHDIIIATDAFFEGYVDGLKRITRIHQSIGTPTRPATPPPHPPANRLLDPTTPSSLFVIWSLVGILGIVALAVL